MIRALFLTILYACPEATAVTLPGTVGLPEVLTEKEWKEDFKNGCFLLFLTLGSSLSCFPDWTRTFLGELLSAPLFPHFELPLNPRWVIADGKNTEHKRKPIAALVLLWILVSFLSSSTVFTVQRSVPRSFQMWWYSVERLDTCSILPRNGTLPLLKRLKVYRYVFVVVDTEG